MVDKRRKLLNKAIDALKRKPKSRVDTLKAAVDVGKEEIANISSQLESDDSQRQRAKNAVLKRDIAEYEEAIADLQREIEKIVLKRNIAQSEEGMEELTREIKSRQGGMMRQHGLTQSCTTLAFRGLALGSELFRHVRPDKVDEFLDIYCGTTTVRQWDNPTRVFNEYLQNYRVQPYDFEGKQFDQDEVTRIADHILTHNYEGALVQVHSEDFYSHYIAFIRVRGSVFVYDSLRPEYPKELIHLLFSTTSHQYYVQTLGPESNFSDEQMSKLLAQAIKFKNGLAKANEYNLQEDDFRRESEEVVPETYLTGNQEESEVPTDRRLPGGRNDFEWPVDFDISAALRARNLPVTRRNVDEIRERHWEQGLTIEQAITAALNQNTLPDRRALTRPVRMDRRMGNYGGMAGLRGGMPLVDSRLHHFTA